MAKGNDGNLLQHGMEAALAEAIYPGNGKMRIILTHGMAPFERCAQPKPLINHDRLDKWLSTPQSSLAPETIPAVKRAYDSLGASRGKYPNSGEIIAALVGRENLEGVIVELDDAKYNLLCKQWAGTSVLPQHGNWKRHVDKFAPSENPCPWLFSMDPNSFGHGKENISGDDLRNLRKTFQLYLSSQSTGAIALFCYALRQDEVQKFRAAVEKLHLTCGSNLAFSAYIDMIHIPSCIKGGEIHNIAAIASNSEQVIKHAQDQRYLL